MNLDGREVRRKTVRHRVYKGAKICFRGLHAAIDCVVRDYSDRGAQLAIESPPGVPDKFELILAGCPPTMCRVVWRKATRVGVEFIK